MNRLVIACLLAFAGSLSNKVSAAECEQPFAQSQQSMTENGSSSNSSTSSFGCDGPVAPPSRPSSLSGPTTDEDGTFTLTFGASTGFSVGGNYRLERALNSGSYGSLVTIGRNDTSYNVVDLAPGTYTYRIRACNPDLNGGPEACSGWRVSNSITVEAVTWDAPFTWTSSTHNEIVGDFDGNDKDDVIVQPKSAGGNTGLFPVSETDAYINSIHKDWTDSHPEISAIEDWSEESYGVYSGNFTSEPGDELLMLGTKQIILLHGDIITPVTIFQPVRNAIVSWNSSNVASHTEFEFDANPADFVVHVGDLTSDGLDEIFLQAKSSGGTSYILSNTGSLIQTISNGYRNVEWSAASYNASIVDGYIDLQAVSGSEHNKAFTSPTGSITSLEHSITKPVISGALPDYIYTTSTVDFVPEVSNVLGTAEFTMSGNPSWLTINSTTGQVTGTPVSGAGGSTYSFSITVEDSNSYTIPATLSLSTEVATEFSIAQVDYDVYLAADGTYFLVSKTTDDVYKLIPDGSGFIVQASSTAEFNSEAPTFLSGYTTSFVDQDGDGTTDLLLIPANGSGNSNIFVSDINGGVHLGFVGSQERPIGSLSMVASSVADALEVTNSVPVTSDVVGSLASSAQVSNGDVNYSVPIKLPPGRRGMQPQVALSYNSGNSNGVAGVGWSLSAGSVISRCGATWAEDSDVSRVDLTNSDRLCLDGSKLILISGSYGSINSEYRTREESFRKIQLKGAGYNNKVSYFLVTDKSGKQHYYGFDTNSTQSLNNTTPIKWGIDKVLDNSVTKNSIHFEYINSAGEFLLEDIYYTGVDTVGADRNVHITYEDRDDKSFQYIAGDTVVTERRISKIETGINSDIAARYYLNYESQLSAVTNKSRLKSITHCGLDAGVEKCLPERQFSYSGQSIEFAQVESTNEIFNLDAPWSIANQLMGDFNGDGILDFVRNSNLHVMKLENDQLVFDKVIELPFIASTGDPGERVKLGQLDFDNDGKLDILGLTSAGLSVASLNSTETAFETTNLGIAMSCTVKQLYINTGFGPVSYGYDYKHRNSCRAEALPDGTGGFYLFHRSSFQDMYLSRIHSSCTNNLCSTQLVPGVDKTDEGYTTSDFLPGDYRIMDIDGDGDPDLTRLEKDGDLVELSVITNNQTGAGATATSTFTSSTITFPEKNEWAMASGGSHWIDANGDGLKDLLIFDDTWKLYLNEGGSFGTAINTGISAIVRDTTYEGFFSQLRPDYTVHSSFKILDYNGDGLEDFMFLDRDVHKRDCMGDRNRNHCREGNGGETPGRDDFNISPLAWGKFSVYLSGVSGVDNVTFELEETEIVGTISYFYPVDIDGDGITDYVGAKNYHDGTIGLVYQQNIPTEVFYHFGSVDNASTEADLLLVAEDDPSVSSFGKRDEFKYASFIKSKRDKLTGTETYKVDNADLEGGDYYRIPTTHTVVLEHLVTNQLGTQNVTEYQYGDSVFHQAGMGFLGYESITEINHATGITSEAHYRMDYPLNGRMTSLETRETSDNSVLKVENLTWCDLISNECDGSYDDVYFIHLKEKAADFFDSDGNALKSESTVYTAYDTYGNLTDSTIVLSDDSTTHTTVLNNKYLAANESIWWVDKLDESTTTKTVSYTDGRGLRAVANGAKEVKRKVTWKTGNARQLATETHSSNDTELTKVITYHTYDSYGNITNIETDGSAVAGISYTDVQNTIVQELDYTLYDGYFVDSESNGLWTVDAVSRTWDELHGNVLTETHANGTEVTNTFDSFGRPATVTSNLEPTRSITFEWCGSFCVANAVYKQTIVQDGKPSLVEEYNLASQKLRIETSSLESTSELVEQEFVYDELGRVVFEYLPRFVNDAARSHIQYVDYDVLGRPASKITSNSPQSYTATYTHTGNSTSISVDGGVDGTLVMAREYNVLKQLISTTDVATKKTYMRYDANGSPILIEDVDGNKIHAEYDSFGNKVSFDDPNNGVWNFRYNGLGQLRWQQDANLVETRFNYDSLGRMESRYISNVLDTTWDYDTRSLGAISTEIRGNLQKDYYYDSDARLTTETSLITHNGATKTFNFDYAYDGYYGRLKALQYPTGEIEAYEYDRFGYLTKNIDPNNSDEVLREVLEVSAYGKASSARYLNGLYDTKLFKTSGVIEKVCVSQSDSCGGANELAQIHYNGFDNFGNLTNKKEVVKQTEEHFDYDSFHRITRSTRSYTGLDAPTYLPSETVDYDYDNLGNLMLKTDYANSYSYVGGSTGGPNAVKSVTKLDGTSVSFGYDANGNMETGDGLSIIYDSFNKPVNIIRNQVTTSFEYGADQSRYLQVIENGTKTTTTYYVDKRFEEIETDDNGSVSIEKRHYLGGYAVLTHKGNSKTLRFLHGDRLDSTYLVTEGYQSMNTVISIDGLEVERRSFDIFGKPRDALWGDTNNGKLLSDVSTRGFTGHEHLDDVELIHMNGRAFDYNLGRFLSVDPFIQFPKDSQSINAYSYLMNNPLSGTDPSGYSGVQEQLSSFEDDFDSRVREEKNKLRKRQKEKKKKSQDVGETRVAEVETTEQNTPPPIDEELIKPPQPVLLSSENAEKVILMRENMSDPDIPTEEWFTIDNDGNASTPTTKGCDSSTCSFDPKDLENVAVMVHLHNEKDDYNKKAREFPGEKDHIIVNEFGIPNVIITPKGAIRVVEQVGGENTIRTIYGGNDRENSYITKKWRAGDNDKRLNELGKRIR